MIRDKKSQMQFINYDSLSITEIILVIKQGMACTIRQTLTVFYNLVLKPTQ